MSIGSLGLVSSLSGAPVAHQAGAAERVAQEVGDRARAIDSAQRAERSAGIGQTEEDTEASDRDADGRLPWERPAGMAGGDQAAGESTSPSAASRARDPSGARGGQLDLLG